LVSQTKRSRPGPTLLVPQVEASKGTSSFSYTRLDFHRTEGNIQEDKEMSLPHVLHHLRLAKALLLTYQKQHKILRASYLDGLAEAIVLNSTPSLSFDSMTNVKNVRKEKELKQLIRGVNMRKTYRKIGKILSLHQHKGLSKIDIPDNPATDPSLGNPEDPSSWKGPWLAHHNRSLRNSK
jgi:hypothetical protein